MSERPPRTKPCNDNFLSFLASEPQVIHEGIIMFNKIDYNNLNAKAKEIYNFHKFSSVLADYGYASMWLNNDWEGADFIAVHSDGETTLKVQLKGRLSFMKKYIGKNILITFIEDGNYYIYPHDKILRLLNFTKTDKTWLEHGKWSSPRLTKRYKEILEDYRLG